MTLGLICENLSNTPCGVGEVGKEREGWERRGSVGKGAEGAEKEGRGWGRSGRDQKSREGAEEEGSGGEGVVSGSGEGGNTQ